MEKDSVETSHPVSTYVEDPREVQQYFDEISYEKGLSVLRMLRGFIGDRNFQLSLRVKIQKNIWLL
jgi:aminopeptidase N